MIREIYEYEDTIEFKKEKTEKFEKEKSELEDDMLKIKKMVPT